MLSDEGGFVSSVESNSGAWLFRHHSGDPANHASESEATECPWKSLR